MIEVNEYNIFGMARICSNVYKIRCDSAMAFSGLLLQTVLNCRFDLRNKLWKNWVWRFSLKQNGHIKTIIFFSFPKLADFTALTRDQKEDKWQPPPPRISAVASALGLSWRDLWSFWSANRLVKGKPFPKFHFDGFFFLVDFFGTDGALEGYRAWGFCCFCFWPTMQWRLAMGVYFFAFTLIVLCLEAIHLLDLCKHT